LPARRIATVTIRFDYVSPGSNGEYVDGPATTPNLAILSWNHVLLCRRARARTRSARCRA
jgi:hypothetical protein